MYLSSRCYLQIYLASSARIWCFIRRQLTPGRHAAPPFPVYHPSSGEAQLSEQLLVALDVAQPLLLELGHLVVLGLELLLLLLLARRLN